MEDIVLSWLVLAAVSPLAGVFITWALFVCHTYRKKWRTLDLFLVGILVANLLTCILLFSYALLNLLAPDITMPQVCALFIWGLTSARTVQVTILASMVVDRALTVRWPYRYRFSVRRNQVRYHLSVLGIIAIFVGVAAIFARAPDLNVTPQQCSVLPFNLDRKFAIFIICLQGACGLSHIICAMDMQIYFCQSKFRLTTFTPDFRASTPSLFSETRRFGLPPKGRNASRRPYETDKTNSDIRWNTVMAVTGICYVINHLPYLITIIMVTFIFPTTTPWLDNGAAWISVAEALLLPFILCMSDSLHFSALVKIFHGPDPNKLDYIDQEDGKFRYADELTETKTAPRNLFGSNPITSVGVSRVNPFTQHGLKSPVIDNSLKIDKNLWANFLPYQGTFYGTMVETADNQTPQIPSEPVYSDPLMKSGSIESDLHKTKDNDHIYATLSDKCGSLTSLSDNSSSVGSIAADDDFEFHNTKTHPGEVKLKVRSDGKTELEYSSQSSEQLQDSAQDTMSSQATTASVCSNKLLGLGYWTNLYDSSSDEEISHHPAIDTGTYRVHRPVKKFNYHKNSRIPRRITKKLKERTMSLSMNDLDKIKNSTKHDHEAEEIMYVLPVKSESTLSLYRIFFEDNAKSNELSKATSEGNLHYSEKKHANADKSKYFIDSTEKVGRGSTTGSNKNKVERAQHKERHHSKFHTHNEDKPPLSSNQSNHKDYSKLGNRRKMLKVSFLNKNGSRRRTITLRNPKISCINDFLGVLDRAKFSYLDNGDLCWHYIFDGDEPEIKKFFVTDYL